MKRPTRPLASAHVNSDPTLVSGSNDPNDQLTLDTVLQWHRESWAACAEGFRTIVSWESVGQVGNKRARAEPFRTPAVQILDNAR